ncbi:MAG: SRPBCC family protein [Acidimicrobiales bacterium]
MRFTDRPTPTASIQIQAPAERVWAVCTDLTRFGEWSPENRGGEWVDGATGPALGAHFKGVQEHVARGRWETICEVTAFDEPRVFEWRLGEVDHPGAVWSFQLAPGSAPGSTELTQRVQMGPGPSGITDALAAMPDKEERIIARRLQDYDAGLRAVLAGIKAATEA